MHNIRVGKQVHPQVCRCEVAVSGRQLGALAAAAQGVGCGSSVMQSAAACATAAGCARITLHDIKQLPGQAAPSIAFVVAPGTHS